MCLSAWLSVIFASPKERASSGQDRAHRVVQMALPDSTWNSFGGFQEWSGRGRFVHLSGDFFPRKCGPRTGPANWALCNRRQWARPQFWAHFRGLRGEPPQQHFAARLAHPHHLERGRLATWQWWHFRWRAQMSCLVPCVSCLMEPVSCLVPRVSWLLSRTRTRGRRQEAQAIRPERCDTTGRFRDMETGVLVETTRTRHARHKIRDLGLEVEDARLQPHHILTCLRTV